MKCQTEKRNTAQSHLHVGFKQKTKVDGDMGEISKRGQKVQISSYKINKSCKCYVWHSD